MVKDVEKEEVVAPKEGAVETKTEILAGPKVGDIILAERIKKKIDLDTVSSFLRIRKIYLKAIEENDYDEMPEFPYGIGFVKSYADYLGLDGEALYEAYKKEVNYVSTKDFVVDADIVSSSTTPNSKYVLISILAVLFVYAAWFLINKYTAPVLNSIKDRATKEYEIPNLPDEVVVDDSPIDDSQSIEDAYHEFDDMIEAQDIPTSDTIEDSVSVAEVYVEPAITKKGVEVVIKDVTWFEVKNDDRLFVSKEFNAGDIYKVPNLKGLYVSAGRVENVDVYVNGVLTKVFTPYRKTNISLDDVLNNLNH